MSDLGVDEDLIVKAYGISQLGLPLGTTVDTVINHAEVEGEDVSSTKSEMDDVGNATFTVGDFVRCTYDDGVDYEAKILYINSDKGTCRIKYAGYDNEQTVNLSALIASWGEEARQSQCAAAMAEQENVNAAKKPKSVPKNFNPPPVPPIPPMMFDDDEEKNQQFAQLLISWFMTGYYTGLHQRSLQDSKRSKK